MACEVCKKPYVALTDDNSFNSDEKPHVCNTCGKSFSLKIQLKRHIVCHEGGLPYVCINCEKNLDSDDKTYNLRLSKKGNFSCETCNKCFNTQRLLLRHASEHTLENLIQCEECGESFKNATALKKHIAIHKPKRAPKNNSQRETIEESYSCSDCGESFANIKLYEVHCLTHTKNKCEPCIVDFPSSEVSEQYTSANSELEAQNSNSLCVNAVKTTNVISANVSDKKHTCSICSKSFARKSALEGHMISHLEDRESAVEDDSDVDADFSCSYKGEKSNERLCLPKLKIRRSFPCEKCQKVYSSKNLYDKHLLFHEKSVADDKNYSCRMCTEVFSSKDDYKMHKLSHHPNIGEKSDSGVKERKSYTCSICNEVFQKKRHLRKHFRIHSEDTSVQDIDSSTSENKTRKRCKRSKDFACGICARRFAGERCLKKHEARHAERDEVNEDSVNKVKKSKKAKTLICEICNQDYSGRSHAFVKHKLSHTPEVCGICDARFVDRAALREHCKIHIGTEEGRRFIECSQKALDAKNGLLPPEPKVEYIYLVLR